MRLKCGCLSSNAGRELNPPDKGGSPALADEVKCHPRQTVFQIGLRGNQGLPRLTNLHSHFVVTT